MLASKYTYNSLIAVLSIFLSTSHVQAENNEKTEMKAHCCAPLRQKNLTPKQVAVIKCGDDSSRDELNYPLFQQKKKELLTRM